MGKRGLIIFLILFSIPCFSSPCDDKIEALYENWTNYKRVTERIIENQSNVIELTEANCTNYRLKFEVANRDLKKTKLENTLMRIVLFFGPLAWLIFGN